MIREDNKTLNKTIVYTYDVGGNIQSKKEYEYTKENLSGKRVTNTINYTYGNTNWKDQLTSYSGKAITYDAIGNPLTYDGNTYTWQSGRELASITKGNTTIEYKYNDAGIRTSKTVNGVETKYYLDGSKVIYEKTEGQDIIYYFYDENVDISGLKYKGEQYYFIKNIQNDIIGILNSNLEQIVSYEYDSWGQVISIKDNNGNNITDGTNIGIINPYRYRSYRYDSETKLYYLNSRYYNPEWGRFINADGTVCDTGAGLIGTNMYIYCSNNPINNMDPSGRFILFIAFLSAISAKSTLDIFGYNNTTNMFVNSLTNKSELSEKTKNSLINKTKNSKEVKKEIKRVIDANNGNNFSNYKSKELNFAAKDDLHLSIGRVTETTISGIKNQDNSWNISIKLYDKYDFDIKKEQGIVETINNIASKMEDIGILHSYEWDISYNFTYYEE